jgi:UDP-3-O-[3-hydroxymyristoyl] glucosamine N-acyltransferase
MEFTDIQWKKTVEGNYDVQLIYNNTIVATINFPTETLAAEYVDIKRKLKAHAEALIAEVTANLTKEVEQLKTTKAGAIAASLIEDLTGGNVTDTPPSKADLQNKVETFTANVKNRIEKAAHIDTSAKVGKETIIDTSAKVGKDIVIDTSAKVVVPE